GRLGRSKIARGAFPEDWQLECAGAARAACIDCAGEPDWHGAHREASPADGGLHPEADDGPRGAVVDFAGCGAALRHCDGERAAGPAHAAREMDVVGEEDSDSRRGAVEAAAFDAV